MSLAEVLSSKNVDKGLDDIFKSSAGPSTVASEPIQPTSTLQKRRNEKPTEVEKSKKRRVSENDRNTKDASRGKVKAKGKAKEKKIESGEEESDEDTDEQDQISSDSEESVDAIPEHESMKKSKKKGIKKVKYAPEGETKEERDARTIFIGNLPVAVVKSKPLNKQLKRHILSFVPSAKIESIRFRSVAFREPTSAIEEGDGISKSSRQKREQNRTADWRTRQDQDRSSKLDKEDIEEVKKGEKTYLSPAEKRRLAAIKGEIHEHNSATTNAYVVFAYPSPGPETQESLTKDVMDPFEAAREAVLKVNGTTFTDHVLRVDSAGRPAKARQVLTTAIGTFTDPRLSIFVGNLDFASREDDVRAFFEKIMSEERGDPNADVDGNNEGEDDGEASDARQRSSWVTRVRIVHDRETQLGKGFAYVQFMDRDCVDEVLALEAERLKFAKRTLRVQRCKALPSTGSKQQAPPEKTILHASPKTHSPAVSRSLPRGDPALGERLAGLPKEARRQAKATDSTRVARRLAKKKARMALEQTEHSSKRLRERKDKKVKSVVNTGRKGKKRERSERNLERKNVKK
ncbi:NOP12_3 [Sanghuangporus weigelae]